jgi:hypothetical protein
MDSQGRYRIGGGWDLKGRSEGKAANVDDRPLAGPEGRTGALPLARANRAGVGLFRNPGILALGGPSPHLWQGSVRRCC